MAEPANAGYYARQAERLLERAERLEAAETDPFAGLPQPDDRPHLTPDGRQIGDFAVTARDDPALCRWCDVATGTENPACPGPDPCTCDMDAHEAAAAYDDWQAEREHDDPRDAA